VIISKLKYDNPLTSIQSEINEIVSCLSLNQQNVEKVKEFCSQEFTIIYETLISDCIEVNGLSYFNLEIITSTSNPCGKVVSQMVLSFTHVSTDKIIF
jgi:adenine-specific DNA methylase